jgi:protein-tyrosine-phosphatase
MNQAGRGRFFALSAGVEPAAAPDPLAVEVLTKAGYGLEGLSPKLASEVLSPDGEPLDFIFTLSDTARGEPLPDWPGSPITAHWSCTDPVGARTDERGTTVLYGEVLAGLERRIKLFMELPFATLDRASLKRRVEEISARPAGG